ncbi:MAG: matrixin family metalloprotease [Planctomycetota bacterium]
MRIPDTYRLVMGGLHWAVDDLPVQCVVYGASAGEFVAVEAAFETWDNATSTPIYGTIHNGGTHPEVDNSVSWGPIDGPGGIIAQTGFSYWVNTKELVEFDIVFDIDEDWSTDGTEDTFDVRNVMTHELGHTLALDDLRSPRDGALTMHAYTWPGDVVKQDLGTGDILGIRAIYGE